MSEQRQPERFLRILGRREVLALAFGAMIGWSCVALGSILYTVARLHPRSV
jgi:hypothetical protein